MEPLSFAEIRELVARRKKHALKLRKRLNSILDELERIEIEIRGLDGKQEGPRPKEREIVAALKAANWNVSATARALGVHRNTIGNVMKRLGIRKPGGARGRASR